MITINELKDKVSAYEEGTFDTLAQTAKLYFAADGSMTVPAEVNLFGSGLVGVSGKLTDWAFNQIAGRLDAPSVRWLADDTHCPPELRQHILNELTKIRPDDRLLIRSRGETVRAVLSDQYTPFDNADLVSMVETAIDTMGVDPQVHRPEVGDELRAYVLIPSITFAPDPRTPGNGRLHPAVYLSNSERGGGSVRITGAVFRYVCGNGMIAGWDRQDVFSIRHRWISKGAMRMMVAEAIGSALKMSEEAAMAFVQSQEIHLTPVNLRMAINTWAEKYGIQVEAKENWLSSVMSEAQGYGRKEDPRLFDLVNGATFVAQQREPAERELMERMAGELLYSNTRRIRNG